MNKRIEEALNKLYSHEDDKYSIKECAHNRFLNGDYDTLKEFAYELWCKNNPEIIERIRQEVENVR